MAKPTTEMLDTLTEDTKVRAEKYVALDRMISEFRNKKLVETFADLQRKSDYVKVLNLSDTEDLESAVKKVTELKNLMISNNVYFIGGESKKTGRPYQRSGLPLTVSDLEIMAVTLEDPWKYSSLKNVLLDVLVNNPHRIGLYLGIPSDTIGFKAQPLELTGLGIVALLAALKNNTHITSLDLTGCELEWEGVEMLAAFLKDNTTITTLKLQENGITTNRTLINAVRESKTLTSVKVAELTMGRFNGFIELKSQSFESTLSQSLPSTSTSTSMKPVSITVSQPVIFSTGTPSMSSSVSATSSFSAVSTSSAMSDQDERKHSVGQQPTASALTSKPILTKDIVTFYDKNGMKLMIRDYSIAMLYIDSVRSALKEASDEKCAQTFIRLMGLNHKTSDFLESHPEVYQVLDMKGEMLKNFICNLGLKIPGIARVEFPSGTSVQLEKSEQPEKKERPTR